MNNLLQSSPKNPCPVCGRSHDTDCRIRDDGEIVLCHTKGQGGTKSIDCPPDKVNNGDYTYKYVRTDNAGKGVYTLVHSGNSIKKDVRQSGSTEYLYYDRSETPMFKASRVDDGSGGKRFSQFCRELKEDNTWGEWEKFTPSSETPGKWISNFSEEKKKACRGLIRFYQVDNLRPGTAYFVEGESNVEYLREKGFNAFSSCGGAGKLNKYGDPTVNSEDLLAAGINHIVLCPDRDVPGMKHMIEMLSFLKEHNPDIEISWLRVFKDETFSWYRLPKSGGVDLQDYIENRLQDLSDEQVQTAIAQLIEKEVPAYVNSLKQPDASVAYHKGNKNSKDNTKKLVTAEDFLQLDSQIEQILSSDRTSREVNHDLQVLKAKYPDIDSRSFKTMVDSAEQEIEERNVPKFSRMQQIAKLKNKRLNLYKILPQELARLLYDRADQLPVAHEFMFNTLLAVVSSLIGTRSKFMIARGIDYYVAPIIRTATVAPSGSKKTPAMKAITGPLYRMEKQLRDEHKIALEQYHKDLEYYEAHKKEKDFEGEKPVEPLLRRLTMGKATPESIIRFLAQEQNRNSVLIAMDEVSSLFKFNQYTGGDHREMDLREFDGDVMQKDTVNESLLVEKSCVCRTGTTQPETLAKIIIENGDSDDPTGLFARWLFSMPPCPEPYLNLSQVSEVNILDQNLEALYRKIDTLPMVDYEFTKKGVHEFETFQHGLVNLRRGIFSKGVETALPKFEAYTAKFAGILHIIHACYNGEEPSITIPDMFMEMGKYLAKYYLGQVRVLHAYISSTDEISGRMLAIQDFAERKDGVTAQNVLSLPQMKKVKVRDARDLLHQMAANGHGYVEHRGRVLIYHATKSLEHTDMDYEPMYASVLERSIEKVIRGAKHVTPSEMYTSSSIRSRHKTCTLLPEGSTLRDFMVWVFGRMEVLGMGTVTSKGNFIPNMPEEVEDDSQETPAYDYSDLEASLELDVTEEIEVSPNKDETPSNDSTDDPNGVKPGSKFAFRIEEDHPDFDIYKIYKDCEGKVLRWMSDIGLYSVKMAKLGRVVSIPIEFMAFTG